jgi:hypothetical protein
VINISAGTGSYEPSERVVIAVEPSELMVGQRQETALVVMAAAEDVPIVSGWADLTITLLSLLVPQYGPGRARRSPTS